MIHFLYIILLIIRSDILTKVKGTIISQKKVTRYKEIRYTIGSVKLRY
jgi:hypothetical protein